MLTILGMLGMMFWLNWDFALMAVAVTPFLLLFVARFKSAVKNAPRTRCATTRATSWPWCSRAWNRSES